MALPGEAGQKSKESVVAWARKLVKGLSKVHWTVDEKGTDLPTRVDWNTLGIELPKHLGERWSVEVNEEARVIWIYMADKKVLR